MQRYEQGGISFEYPDDWEVDRADPEQSGTITVCSPETSFWCLSLFSDRPPVDSVLEAAVDAYRDEYDEVDVYAIAAGPESGELCGLEAVGRDVEFVCLEMVNTAVLRAVATDRGTMLVLFQGTDHELAVTRQSLEKITRSLSIT